MEPDRVAPTVDLRALLEALGDAALTAVRSVDRLPLEPDSDELEPLLTSIDVEERVLFDRVDRVLEDGPELTADARARQREVLDALRADDVTAVRDALRGDVEAQRQALIPQLLHALDADGRRDLAAALEEARLSREESDEPGIRPFEP